MMTTERLSSRLVFLGYFWSLVLFVLKEANAFIWIDASTELTLSMLGPLCFGAFNLLMD